MIRSSLGLRVMACGGILSLSSLIVAAEDVRIYQPLGNEAVPVAEVKPSVTEAPTPIVSAPKVAVPVAPASIPSLSSVEVKTYTGQKGDTLWKISRKCNVSVDILKKTNHLTTDTIAVGSSLTLPENSSAKGLSTLAPQVKPQAAAIVAPVEEVRRAEAVPAIHPPVVATFPVAVNEPASPTSMVAVIPAAYTPGGPTQAELQQRFLAETKSLALMGVGYDKDWTPPGQDEAWDMDCSNTSRYLYRKVAGVSMQRTASDQYYDLHQEGRAWDAPLDADGVPDVAWLDSHLRVGDLLFWQNTYKPRRDPAVTHVMIYLGKNSRGQRLMAGSQTAGGFFNTSGSGPDVYIFKPTASVGGYYKNLGFTHVSGRFVAFGRPLAPRNPVQIASR